MWIHDHIVSSCLCRVLYVLCSIDVCVIFFVQAEDGIRDLVRSRGLGDVYKRQTRDRPLSGVLGGAEISERRADVGRERALASSRCVNSGGFGRIRHETYPGDAFYPLARRELAVELGAAGQRVEVVDRHLWHPKCVRAGVEVRRADDDGAVSYTHLTLPTSDLV